MLSWEVLNRVVLNQQVLKQELLNWVVKIRVTHPQAPQMEGREYLQALKMVRREKCQMLEIVGAAHPQAQLQDMERATRLQGQDMKVMRRADPYVISLNNNKPE